MTVKPFRLAVAALPIQLLCCAVLASALLLPATSHAGQWRVTPARIFLDREVKSSVITVVNEAEEKVSLQGKAMEWTQDAEGKDVYQDTNDLVFFPRMLLINKGEQKIIRAGMKIPAAAREKTYRLFIEEIPQPRKATDDSAQLAVTVRFGVPVFVKPLKEEVRGEITGASLAKGSVTATLKNSGNIHFRIGTVTLKGTNSQGAETFTTKLDGWYLLADAARNYTLAIPQGKCTETSLIEIVATTDAKLTLKRQLTVEKALCLP
jgi:fimbrial chaperone protein